MHDADAIETINREQLATATDRLLLGGGRAPRNPAYARRSPAAPARGSHPHLLHAPAARGSQPHPVGAQVARRSTRPIADPAPLSAGPQPARGSAPHLPHERTVQVRRGGAMYTQVVAVAVAIPTLVGLAIGLVALL